MAAGKGDGDIAKMNFEDALAELQELVKRLEKGETKLDDGIRQYERGMALKRHCEAKLREAEQKVEQIVLSAEGIPSARLAKIE